MGAWGHGPFDNDDAADWGAELEGAGDVVRFLEKTLAAAADETGYLDLDVANAAVAAAAVIASTRPGGDPLDSSYAPDVDLPNLAALAPLAVRALDRVQGDESEWRELWDDSDEDALGVLEALVAVLHGEA